MKSPMETKSLLLFYQTVLEELSTGRPVSTARNLKTVASRTEHEGLSFLTITLPAFGKDFEKSLDLGQIAPNHFRGFPRHGRLPRFLGDFLELVFDRNTGRLLEAPDLAAIRSVRQLTLMFGKIGVPCSDERVQQAKEKYLQCEREVRSNDRRISPALQLDFRRLAASLWSDSLSELENSLYNHELLPKHGPGATADRLRGNAKYLQSEWTERLDRVFPFEEYALASYSQWDANPELSENPLALLREPGAERPVRVITVPKTLKTPRIIAIEPTCMQYMQQAIHERLQEVFRTDELARNLICYDHQEPNQLLAREGSISGALATLDLSEASDRVSYQHVRWMVDRFPHVREAVDATRSRKADIDGEVVRLAKFASMGSALCFPFEAMVFTVVVFLGIERELNRQLTKKDIKSYFGKVRIYGDDIIVPTRFAGSVKDTLELFGFKVNTDKSFWTGKFRESCGKEYYNGGDVSIVRMRSLFPNTRKDAQGLVSTIEMRNHLYKSGYRSSVEWLDKRIRKLKIPYPYVGEKSAILGRIHEHKVTVTKWSRKQQRPLVQGLVVEAIPPMDFIDGYAALLKFYLKRSEEPFADREHLLRFGRPQDVSVRYTWASPV